MTRRQSPLSFVRLFLTLIAFAAAGIPLAEAQAPKAVGAGILHLNVVNLDQSLALYRDLLGMEVVSDSGPPKAFPFLVSDAGALMRNNILGVPGGTFQMELVEWSGVASPPVAKLRIQDPGAVMLAMSVRDIDSLVAGVKKLGLKILSTGGVPVVADGQNGRTRSIMVQDPTGFIVEFVEGGADRPGDAPGNVKRVNPYLSVKDLDQTVGFYNQVFGLAIPAPGEPRPTTDRVQKLFDNPKLKTMRTAQARFPGDALAITFQEFRGEEQSPVKYRVQDAGGPVVLVQLEGFAAAVDAIKANGGIIGVGPAQGTVAADARTTWARDPNGVLVMLGPPPAPAPVSPSPTSGR